MILDIKIQDKKFKIRQTLLFALLLNAPIAAYAEEVKKKYY
jgi:hypothetical protein